MYLLIKIKSEISSPVIIDIYSYNYTLYIDYILV